MNDLAQTIRKAIRDECPFWTGTLEEGIYADCDEWDKDLTCYVYVIGDGANYVDYVINGRSIYEMKAEDYGHKAWVFPANPQGTDYVYAASVKGVDPNDFVGRAYRDLSDEPAKVAGRLGAKVLNVWTRAPVVRDY